MCDKVGSNWVCTLNNHTGGCGSGGRLTIVEDFAATGNHNFSAWGDCSANDFCCTFTDDPNPSSIGAVVAQGTGFDDTIRFDFGWTPGDGIPEEDLEPHTAGALMGFIHGGAGNDFIEGSHFPDSGGTAIYRDNLYGDGGNDTMDGNDDGDWMSGGAGDDTMKGDNGDDAVVGGPDEDELTGESGNDAVCDDASAGGCGPAGAHLINGGTGNDKLWYAWTLACDASVMSTSSNANDGTDDCGDSTNWAVAKLPLNCENPTMTIAPSQCTDPN